MPSCEMRFAVAAICAAAVFTETAFADEFASHVATIKNVQREAQGAEAAAKAVKALSQLSAEELPELLAAFDGASPLAANYLRGAAESLVDRQLAAGKKLPIAELEAFVRNRQGDPRARRLGYEILLRLDASIEDRLIPEMLLDPSPDFRRDAVQRLIKEAQALSDGQASQSVAAYRKALTGATDEDQVKEIAAALKKLGEDVDVATHFGFLTKWQIVGPFNNQQLVGFDAVYSPEKSLDFNAKLQGVQGEVSWTEISTDNEFGILDIAKSIAPHKGAVMYLATNFVSDRQRDVELRLGTPNAWKVWVNGQLLFGRDEYHRGMAIDQYRVKAAFKSGENAILVKLCQNEQTEDWAQRYQLQLRVCDASGVAVRPARRTAGQSRPSTNIAARSQETK